MTNTTTRIDSLRRDLSGFMDSIGIEDNPDNRIIMLDAIYQCLVMGNVMSSQDQSLMAVAASIESVNIKLTQDTK